ncbi:MAG: hypothetical protein PVG90_13980 [Bacillota bacterium]|jgi:hypothetical protein
MLYQIFVDFAEMIAAEYEMDYRLLGLVAAALGVDYVALLILRSCRQTWVKSVKKTLTYY